MEQLRMARISAERLDDSLTAGYAFVTHKPEYTQNWIDISAVIDKPWTPEEFNQSMIGGQGIYPEGIFYIKDPDGELVATATGIVGGDGSGVLHMVAMASKCMGKGLGWPISARAVNYLLDRGMTRVTLRTDDFRVPAVKIYLKMGFVPVLSDKTMLPRWKEIAKVTGQSVMPALDGDRLITNILE